VRRGKSANETRPAAVSARQRILRAAFPLFMRRGFAASSTLDIATAAKVSKRELYALFRTKEALLGACITARAEQMRRPVRSVVIEDREGLTQTLIAFGKTVLYEVSAPEVIGVYRLAVAESTHAPKVARLLDQAGRQSNRAALAALLRQAQALNLIAHRDPQELAGRFAALLWEDLLVRLLLRVAKRPTPAEAERRARNAAEEFLRLYG